MSTPCGTFRTTALFRSYLHSPRFSALTPGKRVVALILSSVHTLHRDLIQEKSIRTSAKSTSESVGALSVLANSWIDGTLVHVFAHSRDLAQFVSFWTGADKGTHYVGAFAWWWTSLRNLFQEHKI